MEKRTHSACNDGDVPPKMNGPRNG